MDKQQAWTKQDKEAEHKYHKQVDEKERYMRLVS